MSELNQFLEVLFGGLEGFVYVPTKEPENQDFTQHFYKWPRQRTELTSFIEEQGNLRDVYISPVVWKIPGKLTKQSFKASKVAWTELDGGGFDGSLYEPTMSVQSSSAANQHLYFTLDKTLDDVEQLEKINRTITYSMEADVSAWDFSQILRPPTTKNFKYDDRPIVTLLEVNGKTLNTVIFANIEEPPSLVDKLGSIPPVANVLLRYAWQSEDYEFFQRESQPNGSRSDAMFRLGNICIEMGMSPEETYAILFDADERWGKYKGRHDREARIIEIINKATVKRSPTEAYKSVMSLRELFNQDYTDVEWVIEDLLLPRGIGTIYSQPGVGKTRLSLQLALGLALGWSEVVGWKIPAAKKVLFLSLEMDALALQKFMTEMASPQEAEAAAENFILYTEGTSLDLDKAPGQEVLLGLMRRYKPDVLFIDSLGAAVSSDVSSNVEVKSFYKFLAKIRHDFDVAVWLIHHGRKATNDNQAPKGLSDMYGSVYIGAEASSVFCLYPTKDTKGSASDPMLKVVKSRFATDKNDKVLRSRGIRFVTDHQKEVKPDDSDSVAEIAGNPFLGIGT